MDGGNNKPYSTRILVLKFLTPPFRNGTNLAYNGSSRFRLHLEVPLARSYNVTLLYGIHGRIPTPSERSKSKSNCNTLLTMKTGVAFVALFAGANAFAPASNAARASSALAGDLEGMIGVGPETLNKIVSYCSCCYPFHCCRTTQSAVLTAASPHTIIV